MRVVRVEKKVGGRERREEKRREGREGKGREVQEIQFTLNALERQ